MATSYIAVIGVMSVLFMSGCIQQQEVRLEISCSAEDVGEACAAACQSSYAAELDAWRCSASGQPVCVCKSYKEGDQFIG